MKNQASPLWIFRLFLLFLLSWAYVLVSSEQAVMVEPVELVGPRRPPAVTTACDLNLNCAQHHATTSCAGCHEEWRW